MVTESIVLYKSRIEDVNNVLSCAINSCIDKIFIIDNSPEDDFKFLQSSSEKVEYIFGHGNIGYGAGHNIAIRKSIELNNRYHIVINTDILF